MDTPVFKVGLVLLREAAGTTQVCLTQIKAKNTEEQEFVDFGLPKGTRRYTGTDGQLHDARTEEQALEHRQHLEPLLDTLREEAQQEIGLSAQQLAKGPLFELGPRLFHSRKGDSYPIHWYVMKADEGLVLEKASEAHAVQWFSLPEVRSLRSRNAMNEAYADVIEESVLRQRDGSLTPVPLP